MKLPISIASKILKMMEGEKLPSSLLQHAVVTKMLDDGVLQQIRSGLRKTVYFIGNVAAVENYLANHFGINNLQQYIQTYSAGGLTRSNAVHISGNSKLKSSRTFSGFLVNTIEPVNAMLRGQPFTVNPQPGSFVFISDFKNFVLPPHITIVGIENSENFCNLQSQQYLFNNITPLFVNRYPQSNDLVNWLKTIENNYLHFGDLDFAGINIYQTEFKKHLHDKASFFVPKNTEELLASYGNRNLYNRQYNIQQVHATIETGIQQLLDLIHRYKKVLEQEIFIRHTP